MDQLTNGTLQPQSEARDFVPNLSIEHLASLRQAVLEHAGTGELSDQLRQIGAEAAVGTEPALRAACLLLADLADQGWSLGLGEIGLRLVPPTAQAEENESIDSVKARLRKSLEVGRNRQLSEPSVRRFLRDIERHRTFHGAQVSVLNLVDDGVSLAAELNRVAQLPAEDRVAALSGVIRPVVQVCGDRQRCEHTGLLLRDIWRYFRHTWSLEYRSTPSRKFTVLIRNAARPMAPVMGIAMISNAPTYLAERDKWIGWRTEDILQSFRTADAGAAAMAVRLVGAIDTAISLIRTDDLVQPAEVAMPTVETVMVLKDIASKASAQRIETLQEVEDQVGRATAGKRLPIAANGDVDWRLASESPLFLRKRASTLAALLAAKAAFQRTGVWTEPAANYPALVRSAEGRRAVAVALGEIRKVGLSSNLMDVSVCGAVPPYGPLLGGKLVAMLLASQEIADAYSTRYGNQVSVIASQVKGAPVTRTSELAVLTTTSLYAIGSSQYNRLTLRTADQPELEHDLLWHRLGITRGFGSAHLSQATVFALRELSRKVYRARRVNNVFGEGTSPRLRQIREGLEALALSSDALLQHSNPRIVYAIELIPGGRRRLLGLQSDGSPVRSSVKAISLSWLRRWVVHRLDNADVLDKVAAFRRRQVQEQLQTVDAQTRLDI